MRPVRARQPPRLPGVEEVADEQRDRGARQDAAVEQRRRHAEHGAAERVDQQELDEVVEREPEEAVDVAADQEGEPPATPSRIHYRLP